MILVYVKIASRPRQLPVKMHCSRVLNAGMHPGSLFRRLQEFTPANRPIELMELKQEERNFITLLTYSARH